MPRATTHRLATALETHRLLTRTHDGFWTTGPTLAQLSSNTTDRLIDVAQPIMGNLKSETGESVQLYRLSGTLRTCVAAQEPSSGLQNTVPVGSQMPLTAGSAARVFLAYATPELKTAVLPHAAFTAEQAQEVLRTGWAESISEREVGLASVSAPVIDSRGKLVAALSISGAAERLRPSPGQLWGQQLVKAARMLGKAL